MPECLVGGITGALHFPDLVIADRRKQQVRLEGERGYPTIKILGMLRADFAAPFAGFVSFTALRTALTQVNRLI